MGFALLGVRDGVIVGLTFSLGVILAALFGSELWAIKACKADSKSLHGLVRLVDYVMVNRRGRSPRVLIYADPFPNVLVVKSMGCRGTVLLSQGLMTLMNEEELRAILEMCIERIQGPGIVFQSFCSTLALWVFSFVPQSLRAQRALTPFRAIPLLLIFPLIRRVLSFGVLPIRSNLTDTSDIFRQIAIQKINQAVRIWGSKGAQFSPSLSSFNLRCCMSLVRESSI